MSERERWIVYPLLFFALGASLRDKFLQQVTTKDLQAQRLVAKQIACEELNIVDPGKPERVVAKLTSGSPGGEDADRFGVLVLIDSEGKELCGVTNNQLQVRQIACDEAQARIFAVVDPKTPQRRLAVLTSTPAGDGSGRSLGSLVLTDSTGDELFGLANDQLQMRGIVCQSIAVVGPENPRQPLAGLGSVVATPTAGGAPQRIGVLELNQQRFIGVRGNPAPAAAEPPPAVEAPAPDEPAAAEPDAAADESDAEAGATAPPAA
ncbi:MAG TPA: hypothetical protein PJ982_16325 [Lacipirellulaceae bacterium]|nr:hypothetical protein [Lacipirellulaceae bacterium]